MYTDVTQSVLAQYRNANPTEDLAFLQSKRDELTAATIAIGEEYDKQIQSLTDRKAHELSLLQDEKTRLESAINDIDIIIATHPTVEVVPTEPTEG